jgi:hypothetical protein
MELNKCARFLRHQRDEVTAEWRKSHSVVLHNLCCSHDIFNVIKIKKFENDSVCAACGERKRCIQKFGWLALKEGTTGKV